MKWDKLVINGLNHYHIIFMALYLFNFAITIACLYPLSFHKGLPELRKTDISASCCKGSCFLSEQKCLLSDFQISTSLQFFLDDFMCWMQLSADTSNNLHRSVTSGKILRCRVMPLKFTFICCCYSLFSK